MKKIRIKLTVSVVINVLLLWLCYGQAVGRAQMEARRQAEARRLAEFQRQFFQSDEERTWEVYKSALEEEFGKDKTNGWISLYRYDVEKY
ncbi:MAG: hypothetical protein Q4C70_15345 [Planctomycetia bacterium]|nr:hypothetical protein [Planctomycetia bacterium]